MNTWKTVTRLDNDDSRQEETPSDLLTWSSTGTQRRCINTNEFFMNDVSNAQRNRFSENAKYLQKIHYPIVLTCSSLFFRNVLYRGADEVVRQKGKRFVAKYDNVLSTNSNDKTIIDAIGLYLKIALQRVEENVNMKNVAEALSKVKFIPHGTISASILILIASSSITENGSQRDQEFPTKFCVEALEHLQKVQKSSAVKTDLERKAHINLA